MKYVFWGGFFFLSCFCLPGPNPTFDNFFFVFCFESHEQFFSYLATATITGDRAANLDLCLALTAFSSESSFTCHTYCDTGPPFLRSCRALGEGAITTYYKRLSFDAAGTSGARTHDLPFAKQEHYH
jgi:hypothetical protein